MPASFSDDLVSSLREETPGTQHVLHFNNAGASLPPQPVVDAQMHHIRREAEIGGYEAKEEAEEKLEDTYDAIATMLGCQEHEVALMQNATRAWDMAFYGFPFETGDRILISRAAYASNYIAALQVAEKTGASIEVIPSTEIGEVDVDALREMMDERVAMITLTHVPTNGGLVNPAAEVGAIARDWDVPYLLDACQSAGQMPLDVNDIGCTMLSATGRKYLRGPRGTGFLYVHEDWIERITPPLLDLHAATWTGPESYAIRPDAARFETFETYVGGMVGLGVAVRYALDLGLEAIFERLQPLAATLRTRLDALDGVTVHDTGTTQCGITTFSTDRMDAVDLKQKLRERRANVSVSSPPSTLLDATARNLPKMVRASVHYYNTADEIETFTDHLQKILHDAS
ncbi:aminotransferase [Longibacter salinarum]|uniref:Aminotransferase n=1 Tax=Longibacter salinarum TaxID=1850348 RepID=A0A2A8CZL6_9BACT|nr:aminotransferase class V-fold PLP-dependent enzyme [Longibacter salinarum]PEN13838.1 aminotransferase [Longibacter salinarum]